MQVPTRHISLKTIALWTAAAVIPCAAAAQAAIAPYKYDIGATLGTSGYLGDANSGFPFRHPGFAADLRGHYHLDTRWSIGAALGVSTLSGNTADITNVLPAGVPHQEFSATVTDIALTGQFNFLPYGIGETYKHLRRITPYVGLGIGAAVSGAGGTTTAAFTIPAAVGLRYKIKPRLNLLAQFSITKAFTDHLDGATLADMNQIKTDFYKNTDWYTRLTVGITYEFGPRCETCHYVP